MHVRVGENIGQLPWEQGCTQQHTPFYQQKAWHLKGERREEGFFLGGGDTQENQGFAPL